MVNFLTINVYCFIHFFLFLRKNSQSHKFSHFQIWYYRWESLRERSNFLLYYLTIYISEIKSPISILFSQLHSVSSEHSIGTQFVPIKNYRFSVRLSTSLEMSVNSTSISFYLLIIKKPLGTLFFRKLYTIVATATVWPFIQ